MKLDKLFLDLPLEEIQKEFFGVHGHISLWQKFGKALFLHIISSAIDEHISCLLSKDIKDKSNFCSETRYNSNAISDLTNVELVFNERKNIFSLIHHEVICLHVFNGYKAFFFEEEFVFQKTREELTNEFFLLSKQVTMNCSFLSSSGFLQIFFRFFPLSILKNTDSCFFPVFTYLSKDFEFECDEIILILREASEKIKHHEILKSRSSFIKATDKKSNLLIKSSLHLESQKFGKKPINKKELIPIGKNENSRIEVIGLDFLPSHYHALNAIQNLLAATNYAGNTEGVYLSKENNSFKFEGKIPRIIFTKSEYLEAYGVKRYLTARNKNEFGGNESKEALDALHYLGTQTHLIVSTRKRWKNGEELVDRYQTLSPILRICEGWEGLTSIENNNLDEGKEIDSINIKHKGFVVEPCPLLVDQIDSYFVLKPANTYQEIKLKYPNTSKFAYTFIDWIVKEATLKRMCKYNKEKRWPEKLSIGKEALAYALRMDSYIRSRNWKKIEVAINRCVEIAISLGWLVEHRSIQGKTISKKEEFILNKNKFHQICKEKNLI